MTTLPTAATIDEVIAQRTPYIAYQPIVDLHSFEVLGHEGLARCDTPGFETPVRMIDAAVAAGLIGQLGRLLRTQAVRGCPDLPLFINIVPQELGLGWLLDPADPIFNHSQQVYLELTESVPVHYFDLCTDILSRARAQGIRLVIDDFGAGYSNILYIADLEPDVVKVDRGLVGGLERGTRRFDLLQNVVNLCTDMGAEVVAEGIETADELHSCIEAGVHYGQGFLLARPAIEPPTPVWPAGVRRPAPATGPVPLLRPRRITCLGNEHLGTFLHRRPRIGGAPREVDLNNVLTDILTRANAFVPSGAGTIFVDDPRTKSGDFATTLVFVACFGDRADDLVGTTMPADSGIVGHVYRSGRPYVSADPQHDPFFYRGIDEKTNYKTESVICVPLPLEGRVIGAIQLLNRVGGKHYSHKHLELLQIFARTISSSVLNAVDAQRTAELAKRDHLTDLFNDRHLHTRLLEVIRTSLEESRDCALLFIDLDRFKQVNDTRGHLAGSAILREMGFLLRQTLPDDAIAARYGGDEFVVIFPNLSADDAARFGEDLRARVEGHTFASQDDAYEPVSAPVNQVSGELTCSVGVAGLRDHVIPHYQSLQGHGRPDATFDAARLKSLLLELADHAMYAAKAAGKNRVVAARRT